MHGNPDIIDATITRVTLLQVWVDLSCLMLIQIIIWLWRVISDKEAKASFGYVSW
jgi:EamA domain-containing membrane protein RarD